MKKIATPEEVATQIVLLSSHKISSHTTGQTIVVAGGMEGEHAHYLPHFSMCFGTCPSELKRNFLLCCYSGRLLNPKD
jgi:hypothetical protein